MTILSLSKMEFCEALYLLKRGKKMIRKEMQANRAYICVKQQARRSKTLVYAKKHHADLYAYIPSNRDLFADDWIIVE